MSEPLYVIVSRWEGINPAWHKSPLVSAPMPWGVLLLNVHAQIESGRGLASRYAPAYVERVR